MEPHARTSVKKFTLILIIIAVILVAIVRWVLPGRQTSPASKQIANTNAPVGKQVYDNSVIGQTINEYFKQFLGATTPANKRLSSYSIDRFMASPTGDGVYVTVYYSVRPAAANSQWSVGSTLSIEGWVNGKSGCTTLKKAGEGYEKITGFETNCLTTI